MSKIVIIHVVIISDEQKLGVGCDHDIVISVHSNFIFSPYLIDLNIHLLFHDINDGGELPSQWITLPEGVLGFLHSQQNIQVGLRFSLATRRFYDCVGRWLNAQNDHVI